MIKDVIREDALLREVLGRIMWIIALEGKGAQES